MITLVLVEPIYIIDLAHLYFELFRFKVGFSFKIDQIFKIFRFILPTLILKIFWNKGAGYNFLLKSHKICHILFKFIWIFEKGLLFTKIKVVEVSFSYRNSTELVRNRLCTVLCHLKIIFINETTTCYLISNYQYSLKLIRIYKEN